MGRLGKDRFDVANGLSHRSDQLLDEGERPTHPVGVFVSKIESEIVCNAVQHERAHLDDDTIFNTPNAVPRSREIELVQATRVVVHGPVVAVIGDR